MKIREHLVRWRTLLGILAIGATVAIVCFLPVLNVASAPGWTTPLNVSHTTYGSYSPTIAYDSQGYAHAVWYGDGEVTTDWSIWYSNNRGGSWSTGKKITSGNDLRFPKIAIDSSDVLHVVYDDRGVDEVMYIRSNDYGATWSTKYNISSTSGKASEVDLTVDAEDNIHAVWIDNRWAGGSLYQITYAKRTSGSWGAAERVQSQIGFNKAPSVTTTGTGGSLKAHITFHGKPSNESPNYMSEMYYVRGSSGSWEAPKNLSNSSNDASYTPDIVSDGGTTLYVVWDETPPGGYHDIHMRRSTDNGTTWGSPYILVTNPDLSRYPGIAYGLGLVHMVYDDASAGYGDVFYVTYDPGSDDLSSPVNLAASSGSSKEGDVAVMSYCRVGSAWMDKVNKWEILYTTKPTDPCPTPTETPSTPTVTPTPVTPTPTITPSPTVTPSPTPYVPEGWLDIYAQFPFSNTKYTQELQVALNFWAYSPIGQPLEMRFDNWSDFHENPSWVSYAPWVANWSLLSTPYECEYKWVFAQYRDELGNTSPLYSDYIFYDSYLTATMVVNEDNEYTNRTLVSINTGNEADVCSGLEDMRLWEEGLITRTFWISYYPEIYFFLEDRDPLTGTATVYAEYRDRAGNQGVYSDSILFDGSPPFNGSPPTLNGGVSPADKLLIPVSGLRAFDEGSGVSNVWFANNDTEGLWDIIPYETPPHTYTWNLGFGGPPYLSPTLHTVFVMYEDDSGYGPWPGNLSEPYSASIQVVGISNVYLPVVLTSYAGPDAEPGAMDSQEVNLLLLSQPLESGGGRDKLLWLAAQRVQGEALAGTLRMTLPEGVRVLRAWSAYGELLQAGDGQVVSQERVSSQLSPWILVHVRVENPESALLIEGVMTWAEGAAVARPLRLDKR
jgi:hypothetical protein